MVYSNCKATKLQGIRGQAGRDGRAEGPAGAARFRNGEGDAAAGRPQEEGDGAQEEEGGTQHHREPPQAEARRT